MEGERPTREQLIELAKTDPAAIADLVLALWDRVEILEAKVASLELNSRNSSKPPSSDKGNFTKPPKPKSLRNKSKRAVGAQPGHKGSTLDQTKNPDNVVEHRFAPGDTCPKCSHAIEFEDLDGPLDDDDCERRQIFELPPIRIEVTEHRAQKCTCLCCGERLVAAFPEELKCPAQYGPNLQSTALYLGAYQLIPYQRLSELFVDLFDCSLSQGTLVSFVKRGGAKAEVSANFIHGGLRQGPLMHCDETGCRLHGKLHWLHVASNNNLTYYHIDAKRGAKALAKMGLLEGYRGNVIHDFYSSYYTYKEASHFLCNAHLLRELVYANEELGEKWAGEMIELLLEAKELRERENAQSGKGRRIIGHKTAKRIAERYCDLVSEGLTNNPEPPPPPPGKRGRPARGKVLNLLTRLENRHEEIMGFFEQEDVPFDNNQAERDLRMMKVREKISGTFRSEDNAKAFCNLRSVISTARKQSRRIMESLTELVRSPIGLGKSLVACR